MDKNLDSSSTPYLPWKALCKWYFRVFINAFMGFPPEVIGFLYALIIQGDAKNLLKSERGQIMTVDLRLCVNKENNQGWGTLVLPKGAVWSLIRILF